MLARRQMGLGAIALILLLVGASTARALSGSDLYYNCQQREGPKRSSCDAYLRGCYEGLITGRVLGLTGFCPPIGPIELGQVRLIMEKYLRDHSAELHLEAPALAQRAFQEAFKC